jgi:hypothetical protein
MKNWRTLPLPLRGSGNILKRFNKVFYHHQYNHRTHPRACVQAQKKTTPVRTDFKYGCFVPVFPN